ncbi:tetratricopeptide repeat protein, partial [Nocardia sp. JCM 34519]
KPQQTNRPTGLIRVWQRGPVAGLYPSLYLNLSECYRKLGDLTRAREYLQRARETIDALGDDEYGRLIRDGLKQVAERLG